MRFSKETIDKENQQSIFQGEIVINQIPVTFQEELLTKEKIGVWMPEDFEAIPEEAIAQIYLWEISRNWSWEILTRIFLSVFITRKMNKR